MSDGGTQVDRQELSPMVFLERAGDVYADRVAVVDGSQTVTWHEFRSRARRWAHALRKAGLQKGDRVALLAWNSEPLLLAHFAVPLAGGVLVAINTRLNEQEVAYIVRQSGARLLFFSAELEVQCAAIPAGVRKWNLQDQWQPFLATGEDDLVDSWLVDEEETISINYTSGTTGRPKGVMYQHRGAYLNSLAMALEHRLTTESRYLWTLPMFHCNGWLFPWALAAVGAQSICIPSVDTERIWQLLDEEITHFCAAPTVLTMLANDARAHRLARSVRVFAAGAPPSPTLIAQMARFNFELEHLYGLTETYGPFTRNVAPQAIKSLPEAEQARWMARQGWPNVCAGNLRVVDTAMDDVPRNGTVMGEVVMRGNVVMKGYFDDPEATAEAFDGGWFHSGDLAVWHSDGMIELCDRKKDIIISGGENISTIEVEHAVASHPSVLECSVIAVPNDHWGEVPQAYVTLKTDATATQDEIIAHCRNLLAHFKTPHSVVFGPLPKTSTGKILKYVLREQAWRGREKRIN